MSFTQEFELNHPTHIVDIKNVQKFFDLFHTELSTFMTYRILSRKLDLLRGMYNFYPNMP